MPAGQTWVGQAHGVQRNGSLREARPGSGYGPRWVSMRCLPRGQVVLHVCGVAKADRAADHERRWMRRERWRWRRHHQRWKRRRCGYRRRHSCRCRIDRSCHTASTASSQLEEHAGTLGRRCGWGFTQAKLTSERFVVSPELARPEPEHLLALPRLTMVGNRQRHRLQQGPVPPNGVTTVSR